MKKQLLTLLSFALMMTAALTLTSCDDGNGTEKPGNGTENPGNGNGNGNGDGNGGNMGVPPTGSRLVSKIVLAMDNDVTFDFTYDDRNRLTNMAVASWSYNDTPSGEEPEPPYQMSFNINFDYSLVDTGVFKTNYVASSEYGSRSAAYTYTIGDNGYLASGTIVFEEDGEPDGSDTWRGTYNADDYLTRSSRGDDLYDITWTGGNMTRIGYTHGQIDYEYGTVANNPLCNLDLNYIIAINDEFVDTFAAIIGLFGKRSANMVSKTTESSPRGQRDGVTSFIYQTDAQGFVTKATVTTSGEDVVYTITYR